MSAKLKALLDTSDFSRGTKKLMGYMDAVNKRASKYQKQSNKRHKEQASSFGKMVGIISGLAGDMMRQLGAAFAFSEFVDATSRMQRFEATIVSFTGTLPAAKREIEYLIDVSNELGVYFEGLAAPFSRFAAAAEGFSAAGIHTVFEAFATAASALQMNLNDVGGTFLALQQIVSKGRVSMEELRLQLAERIPGAMSLAARAAGMSMREFEEAVRKGTINTQVWLVDFAELIEEKFKASSEIAKNTLNASLKRLANSFFVFKHKVMQVTGAGDKFKEMLDTLASSLLQNEQVIHLFGSALSGVLGLVNDLVEYTATLDTSSFKELEGIIENLLNIETYTKSGATQLVSDLTETIKIAVSEFNSLPEIVQEMGLVGAMMFGKKGFAVLAAAMVAKGWAERQIIMSKAVYDGDISAHDAIFMWHDEQVKWIEDHVTDIEGAVERAKPKIVKARDRLYASFKEGQEIDKSPYGMEAAIANAAKVNALYTAELSKALGQIGMNKIETMLDDYSIKANAKISKIMTQAKAFNDAAVAAGTPNGGINEVDMAALKADQEARRDKGLQDIRDRYAKSNKEAVSLSKIRIEAMTAEDRSIAEIAKKYDKYRYALQRLRASGDVTSNELIDLWEDLNARQEEAVNGVTEYTSKMSEFAVQASRSMQSAFSDFFYDMDKGWASMVTGFANAVKRMMADALAAKLMEALLGQGFGTSAAKGGWIQKGLSFIGGYFTGGASSSAASATGNAGSAAASGWQSVALEDAGNSFATIGASANGNAFSNGYLIPFAKGGVVDRTTLFPMAGGNTGMMGEEGAEAVMPLKRTKEGKLGVETNSGEEKGVTIVNLVDPKMVDAYMSSSAGDRIILNSISDNKTKYKGVFR